MAENLCGKTILNETILAIDSDTILQRIHSLGIPGPAAVQSLNLLNGDYINPECRLPNGARERLLDDDRTYYANQVEKSGSDRCYGVAADERQIAVYEYGCNGADAVLIVWPCFRPEYCTEPSGF